MKAHVIKEPPVVLVWNCPEGSADRAALQEQCRKYHLELRTVSPSEAGKTVGELCGFEGAAKAEGSLFLSEDAFPSAIVISGLPRPQVSPFLDDLKRKGGSFSLRALVTLHNRNWLFADLLSELSREKAYWEEAQQ